jgi:hypothetical protein
MANDQEVVCSNPVTVYWMGASDASYNTKTYMKINEKIKVAEWGTLKNKNQKFKKSNKSRDITHQHCI